MKYALISLFAVMLFYGCSKDDDLSRDPETHTYIAREAHKKKYNTVGCIVPNGTCPQQKCVRDPYGGCRKASACECVKSWIIDKHYPDISQEEWMRTDHASNRAFMLDMWLDNPDLFYHPDSIPEQIH